MKRSETEMFVGRRGRAPTQTSVLDEAWERTGLGPFAALRHPQPPHQALPDTIWDS